MVKNKDEMVQMNIYVKKTWDEEVEEYCSETGRVKSRLIQIAVKIYMKENN